MNRLGLIAIIAITVSACGKLPVEGTTQQIVTKTIVDSAYIVKADSLEQVIAKLDSIIVSKDDTINIYRHKNDSVSAELFVLRYKLERVRYYNNIAGKGKNIHFLRGWLNRVLNER